MRKLVHGEESLIFRGKMAVGERFELSKAFWTSLAFERRGERHDSSGRQGR